MFSQGCIFLAKDASSCRPKSLSIDLENTSPCVRCPINDHWAIDKLHRALIHRYSQGSILATFTHIHTIYPLSSFPSKLRRVTTLDLSCQSPLGNSCQRRRARCCVSPCNAVTKGSPWDGVPVPLNLSSACGKSRAVC